MFMVFRPAFCEQQDGIDQTIAQLEGEARDDLIKDVEEYGREIVMRTSEGGGSMRTMIAATMLVMAGTASAAGTKAEFEKYGQPIVQAFSDCTLREEAAAAKGYKTDEGAANEVIDACSEYLERLRARLKQPPFSMSDDEAALNVNVVESDARGFLITDIMKLRKAK